MVAAERSEAAVGDRSALGRQDLGVQDAQRAMVELAGGDPFSEVLSESQAHQRAHGCGLFPAGPAVMQLALMFVRAAGCRTILDLGCGIGYSTFWLANAGADVRITGIDSDAGHIQLARSACSQLGLEHQVGFIVGEAADVLQVIDGPVDAIHDDAWFASRPPHLETMLGLLRPGGLLTMPNWFLLVDALTGQPRNDWETFAGPSWADDVVAYARDLSARPDLTVCWTSRPPLGIAVKRS